MNFKTSWITVALIKSTKNAPHNGTIKNALCEGPYILVMACMLATAVGVAPIPNPQCPADNKENIYEPRSHLF